MTILHSARRLIRRFGLEITRADPMTVWRCRLPALLERNAIGLVLDVGANDGGFAAELLENGYRGRVVSFEPLQAAWDALRERASHTAPERWQVGPRVALGDRDGEVEFFEAGNSVSSSLLPMAQSHVEAAPGSAVRRTHIVPIKRLDDVLVDLLPPAGTPTEHVHLKIDVQGAERMVLEGAEHALSGPIRMVQLEMSLTELYEGQSLAGDLHEYLTCRGFSLWDIVPGFRSAASLRLMQYDGVYLRVDR